MGNVIIMPRIIRRRLLNPPMPNGFLDLRCIYDKAKVNIVIFFFFFDLSSYYLILKLHKFWFVQVHFDGRQIDSQLKIEEVWVEWANNIVGAF